MDENRVVIIGAGRQGLTAAYQLLKTTDIKPIIIEELGVNRWNSKNRGIQKQSYRYRRTQIFHKK